jgi:predicted house-cleaning noncanonical NTP pyrophosphatase (MazG superfamily)
MKIYNKLVRDKIPKIIIDSDKEFDFHIAAGEEIQRLLHSKLNEEVAEFHSNPTDLEELADIMEVIFALAKNLGYSQEDLINKRLQKRSDCGGFDDNIVLEKVYE